MENNEVKNRLKKIRLENNLTQKQLSIELEIPIRTLQNWENGERQIKPDKAEALADHFGVSVGYLLGYQDNRYDFVEPTPDTVTQIQSIYNELNNTNQEKLVDYGKLLLLDQYKSLFQDINKESIQKVRSTANESQLDILDRIERQLASKEDGRLD